MAMEGNNSGTTDARRHRRDEIVATVWNEFEDLILSRLEIMEEALRMLAAGTLDDETRRHAELAAHSASGSLGLLGVPVGTALARRVLTLLEHETGRVEDPKRVDIGAPAPLPLADEIGRLRATLGTVRVDH